MKRIVFIVLIFAASYANAIEVALWSSDAEVAKVPTDSMEELVKMGYEPHPCGWVRYTQVDALPPPDTSEFLKSSERVYEYDSAGKIINQWAMPVDAYLFAISGSDIFVRLGTGALKINRAGKISESEQKYIEPSESTCPSSVKALFGGSDYIWCEKRTDLASGTERFLAYEGVCT
ncbi:hypothetical protein Mag101_01225 [Microbulbifer agarilyticus]|uniref:Uncharacterized protein n=1 Tax=Microbulbifer agarilyticus TaxID=260552 RepID=A0A1Q2M134_9GAMM|nr:hypothetical protein [Microbulbifer agarilyticus]AQQ66420.1 hypothetical protein Mag101_01225 [Microbulbifer agarilyticus]